MRSASGENENASCILCLKVNTHEPLPGVSRFAQVRERESSIEMEITPILDMYQMLEHYLPGGIIDKASCMRE